MSREQLHRYSSVDRNNQDYSYLRNPIDVGALVGGAKYKETRPYYNNTRDSFFSKPTELSLNGRQERKTKAFGFDNFFF